jgi:hypothetical protein
MARIREPKPKVPICLNDPTTSCLMMSTSGTCRGLADTKFKGDKCPFYKDKRQMSKAEVERYEKQDWKESYQGADKDETERLQTKGETIMKQLETQPGSMDIPIGRLVASWAR